MSAAAPVLVACCGNALAGDDAFGPAVAETLRRNRVENVEVLDLRLDPASLVERLEGRRMLVVVDAARIPQTPAGRVVALDWRTEARSALPVGSPMGTHGISIADQLMLAESLGMLPPIVWLVVMTLDDAHIGQARGAALAPCVAEAVAVVLRLAGTR